MSKKVNILVVDDRPEGVLSVQAVLNDSDYNLITAASGSEALRHLLVHEFAVILLDVQMPIMNGFETAAMIKTKESTKDIPIIFMSAINQDEQYVYQGYHAGAVDYLLKPFDPYILRSKVSIFVDMFKKNQLIHEQARKLHESELRTYATALDRQELESLKSYQYLADAIPQIVLRLNPNGSFSYTNKVWQNFTGLLPEANFGMGWTHALHPEDQEILLNLETMDRSAFELEARIRKSDGHYRWHLFRIEPEYDSGLETLRSWIGTATDIEDRKISEDSNRYLAQAGELLVSSLDYELTLKSIAELAVPQLADWCSIDILKDGIWQNVTVVHSDSSKLQFVKDLHLNFLANPDTTIGSGKVLRTGKTEIYPSITKEMIASMGLTVDLQVWASNLENKSAMIIPMTLNEKTIGTLTFVFSTSNRKYDHRYVEMAEELGRRCALSFENSTLYKVAQESIEIRNEFMSIASHELNTPITSLKLQLQMVKRGMSSSTPNIEKFSRSIDASIKQVDRLISLIEVLLDVSRIQSGRLSFNHERFDIADVTREISDRFQEVLASNHCDLTVTAPENVQVTMDKMRIEQVMINLLMNAIKYAPGKIELSVESVGSEIRISVRDFGEGMSAQQLQNIFGRFERASSNRNIGGLGLGLFIVKQIVEGHGGKITVESEEKVGSRFVISLPFDAQRNADHSPAFLN